ncbi:unnamed protein product [Fusarium graminearum]|uniref:Chromosome 3, complete genome n=1 Tax=Gibberella zeae (strain ATCC MYA-4620 / CBS 123657 / FGSC 9075 / NRRL 31084 / PH-1) TaxID=229533 RepID=A0A0E0SPL6_GIBZE|nr:hypothetical protein FG05_05879 [Fusarium graminearum]CEF88379.1 unnamed protein product [Fusarium graminearum]
MSQDLADANVTIARLDEKYHDLEESMERHIISLRGEIKNLKLEHSQCADVAMLVNDLKERVDRLSTESTTNDVLMKNYKLHITISELQDEMQEKKKDISKLTKENRELHQVMDQQRIEIDNLERELEDVQDENFGLTHAQDDMSHRIQELSKENDRLEKRLLRRREIRSIFKALELPRLPFKWQNNNFLFSYIIQAPHQQPSLDPYIDTNDEGHHSEVVQPAAQVGECAPEEITQPAQNTAHQDSHATGPSDNVNTWANQPPHGPRYGPWRRPYYDSYRPPRDITMVDSMVLQSVGRAGSRAPPGLAIHSNSRGGGIQQDVFTKVPSSSKTIAFRVESEETLIQAYRQVKSMNPSASVGGIMFSVAPKADSPFTEIDNIRWGSLTGRRSFSSRFTTAAARSFRNGRSWTFDV